MWSLLAVLISGRVRWQAILSLWLLTVRVPLRLLWRLRGRCSRTGRTVLLLRLLRLLLLVVTAVDGGRLALDQCTLLAVCLLGLRGLLVVRVL